MNTNALAPASAPRRALARAPLLVGVVLLASAGGATAPVPALAVGAGLLLLSGRLGRKRPPAFVAPSDADRADAVRIARSAGAAVGWLAATGDKALLFDAERTAFLMFGVSGSTWVSLGGPIGQRASFPGLLWRFQDEARQCGANVALYEIAGDLLPLCADLGLQGYKFGEVARVPLAGFTLQGSAQSWRRQVLRRGDRDGCRFAVVSPTEVAALMPELRAVSDAWLADKGAREKGFSLGRFDEDYLAQTPLAVVRHAGRVVAFANLLPTEGELSLDLMRFADDAPNGTMDFLFCSLLVWAAGEGFSSLNLGMAPLSGLPAHRSAPAWSRAAGLLFRNGERFYNFRGLRAYKEKQHPEWEPRYVAVRGGRRLPAALLAVLRLVRGPSAGTGFRSWPASLVSSVRTPRR